MYDMAEHIHRPIDVYYPELDVWVRGMATSILPEVGRICVEFQDGSKRLLSKDKHVFKFADEAEDEALAPPEAAGLDMLDTHVTGGSDVDMTALQAEQEEQEAWLKSFEQKINPDLATSSFGTVQATSSAMSASRAPSLKLDLSMLKPSSHATEERKDAAAGNSESYPLDSTIDSSDVSRDSAGTEVQAPPSTPPSSAQPEMATDGDIEGFHGSNEDAERIAAYILKKSQSLCIESQQVGAVCSAGPGLLHCELIDTRALGSLFAVPSHQNIMLRVCVVQSPLHPAIKTSYGGDGTYLLLSEALKVDSRINPYTCRRTPVFRSPPFMATDVDRHGIHSCSALQTAACTCALTCSGCDTPIPSPVAAKLDWWYLSGHLLMQVLAVDTTGSSPTAVNSGKLIGHAAFRICDILAGKFSDRPTTDGKRGWQCASLVLWLPLRAVDPTTEDSFEASRRLPPALKFRLSIALPPSMSVPATILRPRRAPMQAQLTPQLASARRPYSAKSARPPTASSSIPTAHSSLASSIKWQTMKSTSSSMYETKRKPHPLLDFQRSRSKSREPTFGTPSQAIGAKHLPIGVKVSDAESVRMHVSVLQQTVSGLEAQLQLEKVALSRSRAQYAKAQRLSSLLFSTPSTILNLAKAKASTLDSSTKATDAAFTGGDVAALQLKATTLQFRLQKELRHLTALEQEAKDRTTKEIMQGEDTASLRIAIARMRGRVQALRDRVTRRAMLTATAKPQHFNGH